jgi:hypothetical protein
MSPRSIHRGPITAIRTLQAATSSVNHQLERMLRAISDLLLLPMPKIIGLPGRWRTSPRTMMWSRHSRRIDPISRSAKPFIKKQHRPPPGMQFEPTVCRP